MSIWIGEKQFEKEDEAKAGYTKDIKLISRELRHDYMNAFQIIYGYLQLKKSEKAVEHIKKINALTVNISKVYNISITSIAVFLDKKTREAHSNGTSIYYEVKVYTDDEYRGAKNEYDIIVSLSEIFNLITDEISHSSSNEDLIIDIAEYKDRIEFIFKFNMEKLIEQDLSSRFSFINVNDNKITASFPYKEPSSLDSYDTIYSKTMYNV